MSTSSTCRAAYSAFGSTTSAICCCAAPQCWSPTERFVSIRVDVRGRALGHDRRSRCDRQPRCWLHLANASRGRVDGFGLLHRADGFGYLARARIGGCVRRAIVSRCVASQRCVVRCYFVGPGGESGCHPWRTRPIARQVSAQARVRGGSDRRALDPGERVLRVHPLDEYLLGRGQFRRHVDGHRTNPCEHAGRRRRSDVHSYRHRRLGCAHTRFALAVPRRSAGQRARGVASHLC